MPKILPALLVLATSALANAGPTIKLPAEVRGEVGEPIVVTAETEGKIVKWLVVTPGLKLFPPHLLRDSKTAVCWANKVGKYKLVGYTAAGDEPSDPAATVIIVIREPGPGPDPDPDPPGPVDALTKKIHDALAADPGTAVDKANYAVKLAGFYVAMAKHVEKDNTPTVGDLLSDYKSVATGILPEGVIPATRRVCGEEVFKLAGEDSERVMDKALKEDFINLFNKLSVALEKK